MKMKEEITTFVTIKKQGIQFFLFSSLFFVFFFQGWTKNKHKKREKDAAARTNSSSLIL